MAGERENIKKKRNTGHIELILGPMFSGKSTELMRRLKRYQVAIVKECCGRILISINNIRSPSTRL